MRKSEWVKLKTMLENGEKTESILDSLEPKGNNNGEKAKQPEGGISISEGARKYGINKGTIHRWIKRGQVRILLKTNREKYIDDSELAEVVRRYKEDPGQGKWTIR